MLVGCGGSPGPNEKRFSNGEKAKVAAVVDDLQERAREGKSQQICDDLLTPQFRKFIEKSYGTSCATRVKAQLAGSKTTITIDRLQVNGPLASATVKEQDGSVTGLAFVKKDGDWRISRIGG